MSSPSPPARSPSKARGRLAPALLAALATTSLARGALADEQLAWAPPQRARLLALLPGDKAASGAALVEVNPRGEIAVAKGRVLLVPVKPGDRLEVQGDPEAVGLGSGVDEAPDVITWLPPPPPAKGDPKEERREVAVPAWSSARFLVVRGSSKRESRVRVRVAAREVAPLAWYRLDDDIAAWITKEAGAPPPSPPMLEAAPAVRWLAAARSAMGAAASSPAAAAWLMAKWLELSGRLRPIVEPYFSKRSVSVEDGRSAPDLEELDGMSEFRAASAGPRGTADRVLIRAPASDVVRIALRAKAAGPARVVVREGDFPARVLVWETPVRTGGEAPSSRWTEPRWVRAVVPVESRTVTVEVLEGEVAVAAAAYGQRIGIGDWSAARRDRYVQLDRAEDAPGDSAEGKVIGALGAIEHSGSAEVARRLRAPTLGETMSPALRALAETMAARFVRSPAEAPGAAARAWRAASALPGRQAAPLLRSILEHLAAVHPEPIREATPWSAIALAGEGVAADDRAAITALGASISPPPDGQRPLAAKRAEAYAATHVELPAATGIAREAFTHEAPWRALAARPGTDVWTSIEAPRESAAAAPTTSPMCKVSGPHGMRWTLLRDPRTEVVVSSPAAPPPSRAIHAKVLLRGGGDNPDVESTISIDKVPATVHAGAGLVSAVAVSPGTRVFERPSGAPPVLALIPREGEAPCASLRDVARWAPSQPKKPAVFEVPAPGRETVARVVVDAPGKPKGAAQVVRVHAGARVFEAWATDDATGAIEVPVPAGATELRVETSAPSRVRASARLHEAPAAVPSSSSHVNADAAGAEELLSDAAGVGGRGPEAITLPPGSPAVVPLGVLARIPPLPLPEDSAVLRRGSLEQLGSAARSGTGADALLFAVLAARAEKPRAAAEVYERIGGAHRSGAALARAASLWADAAIAERDPSLSLRSYIAAHRAAAAGASAEDVLARVSPAIGWRSPARAGDAGRAWREVAPARPVTVSFEGPAVLRVGTRVGAGDRRPLRWLIAKATGASRGAASTPLKEGEIALDPFGYAGRELRSRGNASLRGGVVSEQTITVAGSGAQVLHITSPGAHARVRVEVAVAEGLPRAPSVAPAPPPARVPPGSSSPASIDALKAPFAPDRAAPAIADDPPVGVLTLGAYALYEDGDVVEEDNAAGVRHFEIGAHLHREIFTNRIWLGLRGFTRLRGGPPSFGGELLTDFAPDGIVPGGYLRGRLIAQTPESAPAALGLRGTAGVMWSVPIWHSLALMPWASVTLLETDPALVTEPAADREIYSRYADTHPRHAVLGARLSVRPLVEGVARLGVSVRTSPIYTEIDRYDVKLEVDVLAGRGIFPWIGVSWLTSVRPRSSERGEAFGRNVATVSATFWRWLSRSQRLSLGGDAGYIFDIPSHEAFGTPRFTASVFIQYDYTGGRGLRDLAPSRRPFQDRQEEGSGRIERRPSALDPAWEAPE